ncbi:spermidine/putrescine transport system ATP-binding protein [Desulfotomaculum arcticum]|uniref:Spermidine/putrescine import ATP-binding protein PotA n=2 Tax=Desulfotruncus TaxID=2867377 RepID=A0A1I2QK37_9FIRM|nr:spermidine/putrescine transport system ATP-binding protein [Desulfotomaculum arcticum] [Desulfotruncus arcticus DSM 17038]
MIELINVVKQFGSFTAVKNLNLNIKQGEFLTLLGPSGCGKTTTLRMIAGFEEPTGGDILMDNESLVGKQSYERNVNTVFQNYALFPHMNVFDNVAFGLRMKRVPKNEVAARVEKALEMVQLPQYKDRFPRQLSGGQQQRVAIARAVVNQPRVLLLDEPLGALDLKMRKQMQLELKRLHKQLGITFVYVTHDQEEALIMSDRIGVMRAGVLEQVDTPEEIYARPKTVFVADFIGEANLIPFFVEASAGGWLTGRLANSRIRVPGAESFIARQQVKLAVRPEHCTLLADVPEDLSEDDLLAVDLLERIYIGATVKTVVGLATGETVHVSTSAGREIPFVQGGRAYLSIDTDKVVTLSE